MVGQRPMLAAGGLIALTVLVLPADVRERYREEFRTELAELGGVTQLLQAVSLVGGSLALRSALQDRELPNTIGPGIDWRCRLGRHRYVGRQDDNPEVRGQLFLQCIRCGKRKDPPSYGPASATTIGWAGPAA
ncbi:MAG TPA: hypothetical protein VIJ00_00060 [Nakamurella sp.]